MFSTKKRYHHEHVPLQQVSRQASQRSTVPEYRTRMEVTVISPVATPPLERWATAGSPATSMPGCSGGGGGRCNESGLHKNVCCASMSGLVDGVISETTPTHSWIFCLVSLDSHGTYNCPQLNSSVSCSSVCLVNSGAA